jgi:hypothetical protein
MKIVFLNINYRKFVLEREGEMFELECTENEGIKRNRDENIMRNFYTSPKITLTLWNK